MSNNWHNIFEQFAQQKVLIIGDAMLDAYMWGNINRQSPEADVPVVNIEKHEKRLGGAANVAKNIASLGAHLSFALLLETKTKDFSNS